MNTVTAQQNQPRDGRPGLVGQFFHGLAKDTGQVEQQGQVIGNPEPGWYLVQYLEWVAGEPYVNRLVRFEDMTDWLFYSDAEAMCFSYASGCAREGGKYRRRELHAERGT